MSSRRKRAHKPPKKHIIPFVLLLVVLVGVGFVGFSAVSAQALINTWLTDLPSIDTADAFNVARKTSVYDSTGNTKLAEFYAEDREPVTAEQVSPYLFNATIAIEDERFWEHEGVDYYGIARAVVVDLMGGQQGASTITQQFVRQTILREEANEISLKRKVREAYLAQELEKHFSKEDVLMMYLNTINYGDGCWGIQSAAKHYFGVNASELNLAQAALLAGIPQSPEYNNPVSYPDNALNRRSQVLNRMCVNGYITESEMEAAKASDLGLNVQDRSTDGIYAAPYFTSYVRHVLLEEFDYDLVFKGGLTVYTTINLDYQGYAEDACAEKEASLPQDCEVSLVDVDPNTGYILAMRGGKDYYADQFNTGWQMQRQAGSTFKVFALAACIDQGISPETLVSGASPFTYDGWPVQNYGGASYGVMSLAKATWISSNTAYARVVRKIGAQAVVDMAHRLGITTELAPVPAVVLGADGVNTLEMASAFGTLATGGVYHKPTAITKIVGPDGEVIYEHEVAGEQVIRSEVAYATTEVLKGVVSGGTGTAANLGWQVSAGKTGTSDDFKDSWFVGYTPQLSTAVWIGSRVNARPIDDNVGGANCCPVWRQFMLNALYYSTAQDFPAGTSPTYDSKATFLTAEEQKKQEEEAARAREEEERKQAEEEAKATDTDGDGVSDWDEEQAGTDPEDPLDYPGAPPKIVDTDGDGYSDDDELAAGTDPNNPASYPGAPPPEEPPPTP
jgi:penicillin-binding protein 1A